jgi:hypothetical protein
MVTGRLISLGRGQIREFAPTGLVDSGMGNTLSPYLGDSFGFATRGQRSAEMTAPAQSFFQAFYALPFPKRDRESRDLFFASNDQSVFFLNLLPIL